MVGDENKNDESELENIPRFGFQMSKRIFNLITHKNAKCNFKNILFLFLYNFHFQNLIYFPHSSPDP